MESLDQARREFAEKIRIATRLRSETLVRAFVAVPRETFVGAGPWKLLRPPYVSTYEVTPDDDPRRLYDNVVVALDAGKGLNNGAPMALAQWLDMLDLTPGKSVLHIGCGVGYYTAIIAEAVAPARVVGVEIDPVLAERARRNLITWPNALVVCADGCEFDTGRFDAIFVNAGVTEVRLNWSDSLRNSGRLIAPLTIDVPMPNVGLGRMLLVVRRTGGYAARFVCPVGIFHCIGSGRSADGNDLLKSAYESGGHEEVCTLLRADHPRSRECWLHGRGFCLSRGEIEDEGRL